MHGKNYNDSNSSNIITIPGTGGGGFGCNNYDFNGTVWTSTNNGRCERSGAIILSVVEGLVGAAVLVVLNRKSSYINHLYYDHSIDSSEALCRLSNVIINAIFAGGAIGGAMGATLGGLYSPAITQDILDTFGNGHNPTNAGAAFGASVGAATGLTATGLPAASILAGYACEGLCLLTINTCKGLSYTAQYTREGLSYTAKYALEKITTRTNKETNETQADIKQNTSFETQEKNRKENHVLEIA